MTKTGKAQARTLAKRAKEAAREAGRSGKLSARAQRAAGDAKRDYESAERNSSRSAERLEERAESAGEHAERAVEKTMHLVREEAEDRARIIDHDSEIRRAARRHKLDLAGTAAAVATKGAEAEAEEEIKALHALAAKFVAVS